MPLIGSNNALAWAQFRLRGGWKRSVLVAIGAGVVLATLIAGHARIAPLDAPKILYGWSSGLMVLQAATLVLYASGRISAGVRLDMQTKLIESHRLMPTPPLHAVAGYVIGNVTQPLVFAAAVFLIGLFTTVSAGMDAQRWLFSNAVLLGFCIFVWVFMAYSSFGARLGPMLIFLPIAIPYASEGGGLSLLPGITLLLSPIAGVSIFDLRGQVNWLSPTYALSFAAQMYFGIILFIAAARRYRAADAVGLSTVLGLCMVLGWCALSSVALREWEAFRPRGWTPLGVDVPTQLIASMLAAMLLALGPISASAREHVRWTRRREMNDPAPMRRPIPVIAVIAIVTLVIILIGYAPPSLAFPRSRTILIIAIAIASAMIALYFLYRLIYLSGTGGAGTIAFIWILLAWIGPIAIDLVRYALSDVTPDHVLGQIAMISPAGALIAAWTDEPINLPATSIGLLLIAAIPVTVGLMLTMRRRPALAEN